MKKLVDIVDKIVCFLIVVIFVSILAIGLAQIISRRFLKVPIVWVDESSKYLFVWLVMLGAAYGVRKKKHVAADVVIGRVGPHVKKVMDAIIDILSITLCAALIFLAPRMIAVNSATISPTLGIPMSYVYIAMLLGPILMLFYTLVDIYERYILKHPLGGED